MSRLGDFAVVVLAAGRSVRMGDRNKLLEQVGGKPLLAHSLATIASLAPGQLIVVTGHEPERIGSLAVQFGARAVHNASYRDGMGASLACGARAVDAQAQLQVQIQGVFIHLGDVPFVSPDTFLELESALGADQDRINQVFVPVHKGRRGHPVLFRGEMLPLLCELRGDEGARRVIGMHHCLEVEVDDPAIDRDMDTPADLAALSSRAATR